MAVAMIIGLWIYDEVSANKNFKNYDTIYQVMMNTKPLMVSCHNSLPYPLGEELKNKFPDFKAVAMWDWGQNHSLIYGEEKDQQVWTFYRRGSCQYVFH